MKKKRLDERILLCYIMTVALMRVVRSEERRMYPENYTMQRG